MIKNSKKPQPQRRNIFKDKRVLIGLLILVIVIAGALFIFLRSSPKVDNAAQPVLSTPKKIAERKDVATKITVFEPADGAAVTTPDIVVSGMALGNSKYVTINGVNVPVKDGKYSTRIALSEGVNTINVTATDEDGKETSVALNVTRVVQRAQETPKPSIYLSGSLIYADAELKWSAQSVDTSRGFHILSSNSPNPKYPDNHLNSSLIPSFRKYQIVDGKMHYYRVCQIVADNSCGVYSNEIAILGQIPSHSIKMTITEVTGTTVKWNFDQQSPGGFILLWSTSAEPTFGKDGVYAYETFNPIGGIANIDSHAIPGETYHVRVCEDLGAKCGTYSNEVTLTVQ